MSKSVTKMKKKLSTFTYVMLLMTFLGIVVAPNFQSAGAFGVEGIITNDTVWTVTNSPYEVISNVTIANGVKLTIEPGAEILFETGSSLIVNGSLHAVGTSVNRISFTSNKSKPVAGDWNGIKFYGDENSTLTTAFCDVKYAKDGITVDSLGKAVIEKSTVVSNSLSGIHAVGTTELLVRENNLRVNVNGISASGVTCSGLKIVDNYISNNENGVYLNVYGDDARIHNVTIVGNSLKDNTNGIYLHSSSSRDSCENAYISNVTISNNIVTHSEYGICLVAEGWGGPGLLGGGTYIYDSLISNNTISFSKNALHVNSSSNWYSWIFGLTISRNIIHSSEDGIFMHAFRTPKPPLHPGILFDVVFMSNIISANGEGVRILGDVRANFTGNSVLCNSYGIYLDSSVPSENVARNNDIYRNTAYGIYVAKNASINAEHNYWGDSSGAYHETLNSSGEGDRVNGDGENLDFTPFLTEPFGVINNPPFAVLKADKTIVVVNQTVIFDGFESSDDSSIIKYFFDFGDGETMQAFPGAVRHEYGTLGIYNVSLVVMDDLGINSTNRAIQTVTVARLPSLVVSVFPNPLNIFSDGQATVEVHVGDEVAGIEGAFVELASNQGGNFELSSGYTNSTGDFESTFYAPNVSESTILRIVATASKEGYENGSDNAYLSVLTPPTDETESNSYWIWFVAIAVIVVIATVAVFMLLRRKRNLSHSVRSTRKKRRKKLTHG